MTISPESLRALADQYEISEFQKIRHAMKMRAALHEAAAEIERLQSEFRKITGVPENDMPRHVFGFELGHNFGTTTEKMARMPDKKT